MYLRKRFLLIMLLILVMLISVACSSESNQDNMNLEEAQGIIVDKRETETHQILVTPNIKKETIGEKSDDELTRMASRNDGAWYSIDSSTYASITKGDQVSIQFNSNGVLESKPPQFVAEDIKVITD
ncbi:hypothetical protein ABID56_001531 [Alkalibacillus flavidus]|uniref:DUF3221 domain-containing protein n=1 Tax=Alkalibacillus flavidus TaxID=546021 RepID=A0ABV2KV22_9BACI